MARRKTAIAVPVKSIWAEIKIGDSVYLDGRLGVRAGRWEVAKFYEDGFAEVRKGRLKAIIRGDALVGWFMGKEREERSPVPYGQMVNGPEQRKKPRDRSERAIEVE